MSYHHNPIEGSHYEPDDPPELPDGCWDEDTVDQVKEAVKNLCAEQFFPEDPDNLVKGVISVKVDMFRISARLLQLRRAIGEIPADDWRVLNVEKYFKENP